MPKGIYKRTEEHNRNIGNALRGEKAYWFGKKLSNEHKAKISPIGRIRSKDSKDKVRGPKNGRWQGGLRRVRGYLQIYLPSHPNCNSLGYVLEHRLVMEKRIGRFLKRKEVVHHINGIKSDNRPINLTLFASNSEHMREHTPKGCRVGTTRNR